MPLRADTARYNRRKAAVDGKATECVVHGVGCRVHRIPDPARWGIKDQRDRWSMTPDEALDAELEQAAFLTPILRWGKVMSEQEFIDLPCKTRRKKVWGGSRDNRDRELYAALSAD